MIFDLMNKTPPTNMTMTPVKSDTKVRDARAKRGMRVSMSAALVLLFVVGCSKKGSDVGSSGETINGGAGCSAEITCPAGEATDLTTCMCVPIFAQCNLQATCPDGTSLDLTSCACEAPDGGADEDATACAGEGITCAIDSDCCAGTCDPTYLVCTSGGDDAGQDSGDDGDASVTSGDDATGDDASSTGDDQGDDASDGASSDPCVDLNDGTYCGGDLVTGDASTLYQCASGVFSVVQTCDYGCAPSGGGSDSCY